MLWLIIQKTIKIFLSMVSKIIAFHNIFDLVVVRWILPSNTRFFEFFFYVVDERLKLEEEDLPNMSNLSIDLQKQVDSQKNIQGKSNNLFSTHVIVKKSLRVTDFK